MWSAFTLLLVVSSAVATAARPGNAEPTKVTKLHTNTDIPHASCHTADADIHARQLTDTFPSPTWSEPSWLLFGAPTATPNAVVPAIPPPRFYRPHKGDNLDKIVPIAVICSIGGSLILFGIIRCIVNACVQRSRQDKGKVKNKGKGKAPSLRTRSTDVEMTAGLTAHAAARAEAPAEGYCAPRRFEVVEEIPLMPQHPEPVFDYRAYPMLPKLLGHEPWDWEKKTKR